MPCVPIGRSLDTGEEIGEHTNDFVQRLVEWRTPITSQPPRPTDQQLRILRVLWDEGPSTVSTVEEELNREGEERGYTTYLKWLQIMHEEGLVSRDESARAHVYSAEVDRREVERGVVRDLLDKAFSGAAGKLALRALSVGDVSDEERQEIRRLLEQMEG